MIFILDKVIQKHYIIRTKLTKTTIAMKRHICFFSIFLAACGAQEQVKQELNPESLVGTWERVSYVDSDISDTAWVDQNPKIIFLKHLTPTHFTWLSFNTETEELNGTGGGTYQYDGTTYTEDIMYFYPTGSSIQGQTIPFTVDFVNGNWHHVGYFQNTEYDPEMVEIIRTDTSLIEEMWKRVPASEEVSDLVGTWELVSQRKRDDSTRIELPPFMKYYKLVTPTHFNWVQINMEDNEVYAQGGGTFIVDGNTYTERLLYHHPVEEALRGLVIPFNFKMENERWYHRGTFIRPISDKAGNKTGLDTVYIDEVWQRWKPQN
jgi:hypothetical protein